MKHHALSTMGRFSFAVFCLLFSIQHLSAQQTLGRQIVDQYPVTAWGTPTYGLTWLPTDYGSTKEKYPLIIFLHGSGEGGDGVGGLWNLVKYGLPMMIANGFNPEAVNPTDGKNYKFIVVSPQAPSAAHWSYAWGSVQWVLQDVMSRYRIDPNRIYVTGISAGGAGTWSCVTNGADAAKKFAAIVPVSAAGTNYSSESDQLPLVGGTYGAKAWSITGSNDAWLAFAQTATKLINASAPDLDAWLTAVPGGHDPGAWNTPYDPNWRNNAQSMNIYEWMLKYKRGGKDPDGGPGPGPGKGNQSPTANAGPDQTVTLPLSSIQLNGTGNDPDGSITAYKWSEISGPNNAQFSRDDIANPVVSNLAAGTYVFRLTVTDDNGNNGNGKGNGNPAVNGATGSDDMLVTVNPAPSYANLPARIEAENYVNMNGIQTENTGDGGGGQDVGWQDNNDWLDYNINVPSNGKYTVGFRVASPNDGVQFQVRKSDGSVISNISVPNTGGWQNWQTLTVKFDLPAGKQTLRIYTSNASGGWNINWMDFAPTPTNQNPVANAGADQTITLPANSIQLNGDGKDADGSVVSYAWTEINGPNNVKFGDPSSAATSVSSLIQGVYILRLTITDNDGATDSKDVHITVNGAPAPPPVSGSSLHIEAENWSAMSGVWKEATSDAGGGYNVGSQDLGDWEDYSVNVPSAGTYTVNFRIATMVAGAQFQVRKTDGTVLATVSVPSTGTYQNWQTISTQVTVPAGQQTIRIVTIASPAGWNLNWFEFSNSTAAAPSSLRIEAENWSNMSGVWKEPTKDDGGGWNVGSQDLNDWVDYSVNLPASGTYTINFRIATMVAGAQFQLRKPDGSVLANMSVPSTGTYQTWQTVSTQVTLAAGQQSFRIYTTASPAGWNLNWFEFVPGTVTASNSLKIEAENWSRMNGVQTETTSDAGGGLNVGGQDPSDWEEYSVSIPSAGYYNVNFRIATMVAGAQFQLKNGSGAVLATLNVPSTGSYQSWQTISAGINLPAGIQTLRIVTTASPAGWNLNWFELQPSSSSAVTERSAGNVVEQTILSTIPASTGLFPNPVRDEFTLQVNSGLKGLVKVEVIGVNGAVQKQFLIQKDQAGPVQSRLSTSGIAHGNYFVRITQGKWTQTLKMSKE